MKKLMKKLFIRFVMLHKRLFFFVRYRCQTMNRILPVRLRNLSSSHPIAYWIVNCIALGGRLGFLLVLFFILIGGICFFYDYVVGDDHTGALFVAFVLFPIVMAAGYPWSWEFFKANNNSIPGILGCIILNGLLAGVFYAVIYVFGRFIALPKKDKKGG
jgi:hypothetical protein